MADRREPDRYEPLPGIVELPRWLWARMGRRLRIVAGLALVAAVAAGIPLAAGLRESSRERAASERAERAELRERQIEALREEQRPRFGRADAPAPAGAPRQERLDARRELIGELSAAILADARLRVRRRALDGPIRRTECEPFPRRVDGAAPEEDLRRERGRYFCLAVTADFESGEGGIGGAIGHPYRALVDFDSGRYAFCKIAGRPEPTPDPAVETPRACGG